MLSVSKNGEIELTRGDSACFTINISNGNGQPYTVQEGDTLTLSLKKDTKDPKPCVQKSVKGINTFRFKPEDTSGLEFGNYYYDVEICTAAGDVYTVIEKTAFKIKEEVTTR